MPVRLNTVRTRVTALSIGPLSSLAPALTVDFRPVVDGVVVHVGDTGAYSMACSIDNEGLHANTGLVGQTHGPMRRLCLVASRAHMKQAVDAGIEVSAAVKSFDARPFMRLHNAAALMTGNASRTFPELERA